MDTLGCHIAKNSNIQSDQGAGNITAKDAFYLQKLAGHANALVNGLASHQDQPDLRTRS
jgi:hypothetical protein